VTSAADTLVEALDFDTTLHEIGPARSLGQDAWRRFKRNKLAMFGLALVVLLLLIALIGPFLVQSPSNTVGNIALEKPTQQHWFGTDNVGRDVLARVVYGIRLSLFIGVMVAILETVLGIFVGAISGWFGKWTDTILMRFVDIMLGIPYILLAFAIITVIGRGFWTVILVLALTSWLQTTRVVRAGFLQTKEFEYVEAARAMGVGSWRIIWRHILPNVFQPVVVLLAIGIGSAILGEAALSFLGVGVIPPTASLGLMIAESQPFFSTAPYLLIFPGLAVMATVLGFLLVGDGLRDALDVRDVG
jgi:ABC-type dipeptide/oligopeptide/nickel transport system permease subunit